MDQREFERWQEVTSSSQYMWVEDAATRMNGRGCLYYSGGESGIYMRITPAGKLQAGHYEGAVPHIGEALFKPLAERECGSFNEAFQLPCFMHSTIFRLLSPDCCSIVSCTGRCMPWDSGAKRARELAAGRLHLHRIKAEGMPTANIQKGGFYLGQSAEQHESCFPAVCERRCRHGQVQRRRI